MTRGDRIDHDRAADAAAYAVGALEPDEAQEFARHLAGCAQCRGELAAFHRVVEALPMAVPQYPPSPALRKGVRRAVRAEPRLNLVAPRPGPSGRTAPWPASLGVRAALVAAAAVVLLVALIAAVRGVPGRSAGSHVLAASVVGSPGTAELRITGNHAELIVRHLRAPATGRIYEVWLRRGDQAPAPTTALFSVTAPGAADVGIPGGLGGVSEVLVTQEPAGGSRVPTGPPLIVAPTS